MRGKVDMVSVENTPLRSPQSIALVRLPGFTHVRNTPMHCFGLVLRGFSIVSRPADSYTWSGVGTPCVGECELSVLK